VRELPPTAFVLEKDAIALPINKLVESGYEIPSTALHHLRAAAQAKLGALPRSKVVLYPMSGFDAGTPIHLFPDATTIIGVDNHPFLPVGDARTQIPYSEVGTHNFAFWGDVDKLGHVGPAIVGALKRAVPGFRLRHVSLIEQDASTDKAVHAVVEFDGGPGTPTRRYIHVNGSLEIDAHVIAQGWWKMVEELEPDSVLIKGSQNKLSHRRTAAPKLREQILGWLRQRVDSSSKTAH
jgi:hypothetical protein